MWPVQMFHSTSGDDFSFAFQQHFNIPLAAKVYQARNGKKTFSYTPPSEQRGDAAEGEGEEPWEL